MKRKPKDDEKGKVEVDEEGYMTYKVKGVVTTDFDGLVSKIINMRGYNPHETDVLCGLDDGQKFNKTGFIVKKKQDQVVGGVNVMSLCMEYIYMCLTHVCIFIT